jgi:hypothetical protein
MRRAFAAPAAASARFSVRASMVKRIGKKDGGVKEMAEEKGDNRRGWDSRRDKEKDRAKGARQLCESVPPISAATRHPPVLCASPKTGRLLRVACRKQPPVSRKSDTTHPWAYCTVCDADGVLAVAFLFATFTDLQCNVDHSMSITSKTHISLKATHARTPRIHVIKFIHSVAPSRAHYKYNYTLNCEASII